MKKSTSIPLFLSMCFAFLSCSSNTEKNIEGLWFEARDYYYHSDGNYSTEEYDFNNLKPDSKKWKITSSDENNGTISIYEYGSSGWDEGRKIYYTLKPDTLWIYYDEDHIDGPYKMPIKFESNENFILTVSQNDSDASEPEIKYEFVRLE